MIDAVTSSNACLYHWGGIIRVRNKHRSDVFTRIKNVPASFLSNLALTGLPALGIEAGASHIAVSASEEMVFRGPLPDQDPDVITKKNRKNRIWRKLHSASEGRLAFETHNGSLIPSFDLNALLERVEPMLAKSGRPRLAEAIFVAEIAGKTFAGAPQSLLATTWNEFLGKRPIPFDSKERSALIQAGCEHVELRRHIEAWRKMA